MESMVATVLFTLLSLCLMPSVRCATGSDFSLRLGRINVVRRHANYGKEKVNFKIDYQSSLCDLDTSNWVASTSPEVKLSTGSRREKKSRKILSQVTSSRKRWFLQKLPLGDNEVDSTVNLNDEPIDNELLEGVTSPLMPQSVWDRLTGNEFSIPSAIDRLAGTGLFMATTYDENDWVEWKPASKETSQAMERGNEHEALDDDHVLVYVGHPKKKGVGSQMPFVKTKSIAHFSPRELAELLLDSSRVRLYNKFSLGRTDLSIMQEGLDLHGPLGLGETKVVQSLAQPPITNKKMLSVTLLHGRPLPPSGPKPGYLIVSRALGGNQIEESHQVIRNYILLGVNLLEPFDDNKCLVTSVTHLHSPSLPSFLAARFGVKSAVKFAKDIRQLSLVKVS